MRSRPAQKSLLLKTIDLTLFYAASLRLDAPLLDHPLPFSHLPLDESCKLGRAHLHDCGALAGEVFFDFLAFLHRGYFLVQFVDDGGGGAGGGGPPPPACLPAARARPPRG